MSPAYARCMISEASQRKFSSLEITQPLRFTFAAAAFKVKVHPAELETHWSHPATTANAADNDSFSGEKNGKCQYAASMQFCASKSVLEAQ